MNVRRFFIVFVISAFFVTTEFASGQGVRPTPRAEYEKIETRKQWKTQADVDQNRTRPEAPDPGVVMESMAPGIDARFGVPVDQLPPKVDLRPYLPAPGDQGSKNDCLAWAVAYASYTCQICQERRHGPKIDSDKFSPHFLYDKLGENNQGLFMSEVATYLKNNGCPSMGAVEASQQNQTVNPLTEAGVFKRKQHERAQDLTDMKTYLYEGYPVVLVIQLGPQFHDKADTGPYDWAQSDRQATDDQSEKSYHAIAAVAYDDARDAVLVMNSWGSDWKENGFCWVKYSNFDGINDNNWCSEAHVIRVKRAAPYNARVPDADDEDDSRLFQLKYDRKVYEFSDTISPNTWKIDDIAANEKSLFVLRRDQTVYKMLELQNGRQTQREWIHLDNGLMTGKKVTMLAADETAKLHALTESNELFEYARVAGAQDGNGRPVFQWSKVILPNTNASTVDIRMVNRKIHAITSRGTVFVHNEDSSQWQLAP